MPGAGGTGKSGGMFSNETATPVYGPGGVKIHAGYGKSPSDGEKLDALMGQMPQYQSMMVEPGKLGSQFAVDGPGSNMDGFNQRLDGIGHIKNGAHFDEAAKGLQNLTQMANSQGPTQYAQAQQKNANLWAKQASDMATKNAMGAAQTNMNQMALQGGLSGGARERMGKGAAMNQMMAKQGVSSQLTGQMGQIDAQDAQFKQGLATQLPGMQMSLNNADVGVQQYNTGLDMKKTGMWGDMANTEADRNLDIEKINTGTAIKDHAGGMDWAMEGWKTHAGVLGNKALADKQGEKQGGGGLLGRWFR
jgi:hypothetical protein